MRDLEEVSALLYFIYLFSVHPFFPLEGGEKTQKTQMKPHTEQHAKLTTDSRITIALLFVFSSMVSQ